MNYTDAQRIEKIRSYTDKLLEYVKNHSLTREQVLSDETVRWTLTTPLYNIGEHAYYLSKEFRELNDRVPWNKISGLRHRLVHDYEDTNWTIICDIIFDVLPEFKRQLESLKELTGEE